MRETIAFIGGGNMATSLIGGLLANDHAPARVLVVEPDAQRRDALAKRFGVTVCERADPALGDADIWVLAVKPQLLARVVHGLPMPADRTPLIVSIAAGVRTEALASWFDAPVPLVRCMPNTAALIGAGATALYAGPAVDAAQRAAAENVLSGAGLTLWVDSEEALDAVTATSGSGPAYFFALMQAMQSAARDLGLAPDIARRLVLQTALGAARMALESGDDPGVLRSKVTSPGGTTERALAVFEEGGFDLLVGQAMRAAAARSVQLAQELAQQEPG